MGIKEGAQSEDNDAPPYSLQPESLKDGVLG